VYQDISPLEIIWSCCEVGKEKTFDMLRSFDSSDSVCVPITRNISGGCPDSHGLVWDREPGYENYDTFTLRQNHLVTVRSKWGDLKIFNKEVAIMYMEEVIPSITHGLKLKKRR
jgi:hypothetical protein